jgi:hypothetical protein
MHKYILAVGCSYTIGHDCEDSRIIYGVDVNHQYGNWPHYLGKLTDRIVVNKGANGVGSFYMANQVYELVDEYNDEDFVVMVMWSGLHRYDMIENDEWLHSGMSKTGREGFRENYLKYMYSNQNAYYHTILNMLNVQNFLKQKNIKYLFLTHRDILSEFYQKYEKVSYLEKCIDWDNFYFHDGFKGCMEWCVDHGFELNDSSHPYTEGYVKYAEHLYDVFNGK